MDVVVLVVRVLVLLSERLDTTLGVRDVHFLQEWVI
jgi:hypothetical protein